MTPSIRRRQVLQQVTHCSSTHPALWLERYLQPNDLSAGDEGARAARLHEVATRTTVPEGYAEALALFEYEMHELGALRYTLTARGRLAIWLKSGSAMETGMAIHHVWGVPIIPARTLKGAAAGACEEVVEAEWCPPDRRNRGDTPSALEGIWYDELFGTAGLKGRVTFLDAWWKPPLQPTGIGIDEDVMTPHYNDYYLDGSAPTGSADPVPVPFPTASGTFVGWLLGPDMWVERARELVGFAAGERGLGARAGAGYGYADVKEAKLDERLVKRLVSTHTVSAQVQSSPVDVPLLERVRARLGKSLSEVTTANCMLRVPLLLSDAPEEEKQSVAELLLEKLGGAAVLRTLPPGVQRDLKKQLGRTP